MCALFSPAILQAGVMKGLKTMREKMREKTYLVLVELLSLVRCLEDCWHDCFVGMIFFSTNAGDF